MSDDTKAKPVSLKSEPVTKPVRLLPAEFYSQTRHGYPVPPNVKIKDLLDPTHWVHVAKGLKTNDIIVAPFDDGSWYYELLVLRVGGTDGSMWATVVVKEAIDLSKARKAALAEAPAIEEEDYTLKYQGGAKWCVYQKGTVEPIAKGLDNKEAAEAWLDLHLKTMKAA